MSEKKFLKEAKVTLDEVFRLTKRSAEQTNRAIGYQERLVGILQELILPRIRKLEIVVAIIMGFWIGGKISNFYRFISPHFSKYFRYIFDLYNNSSNDTKLYIVFIIPVSAVISFLFYKLLPKIFSGKK